MIPLFHELSGARVLIFGGGRVGARKSRRFAREADVVVLSPTFADADFGRSDLVRANPTPDDVEDWIDRAEPMLVVAATDDETLNAAIEAAAREREVLINRVDRSGVHEPGDVVVPATYRDDPVVVAVSTSGTSPALSRYLRQRFEEDFAGVGGVATATGAVRDSLNAESLDRDTRRELLRRLVGDERLWRAARTDREDATDVARQLVKEYLAEDDPERT